MNGKSEILSLLSDTDGYVSGQALCEALGVSRTAVWKVINQLRGEGYGIESSPGRGYRITGRPDLITAEEIKSGLHTRWAAQTVCFYESVDSTNDEAKRLAGDGAPEGTLVVAERQQKGKGRRGRSWITPAGSAIAMSLILRPDLPPERAPMLTLLMGMAVTAACREYCGVDAGIKWPNDVLFGGKKICGILTEMNCEVDYIHEVVIGVGINTGVETFPPDLSETAVSLHTLTGKALRRAELIQDCMEQFERYYETFSRTGEFSLLREEYNAQLVGKGQRVRILVPGNEWEGISVGINDRGELLVQKNDGTVEPVFAGEVSVRGLP